MTTWLLCDEPGSDVLRPLTWLRPASELRFGADTLEGRWRRLVAGDEVAVVSRDALSSLRPGRVSWGENPGVGSDTIWVRDRFVPTGSAVEALRGLRPGEVATFGGQVCACRPSDSDQTDRRQTGSTLDPRAWPESGSSAVALDSGDFLAGLGDLVRVQSWVLGDDLGRLLGEAPSGGDGDYANGNGTFGDGFGYARERILVHASVRIDHGAILDAREGGIVLGEGCVVLPGVYLRGPLIAAERCLFLGGTIGSGSSFGPVSRVRGEVESTVFLGFSNKAHDGFLGHSYVGEWVNLGAMTTTSDLRNDYGEISLERDGRRVPTGSNKIGTFFGDHAKTRIGCLLGTGTVVGLGANVFGNDAVPEREIVDFQWGTGDEATEYRIDRFLEVARTVLGRRGVGWDPAYEAALRDAHAESQGPRMRRVRRA